MLVPTVIVKDSSGQPMVINKADYDPGVHELVEVAAPTQNYKRMAVDALRALAVARGVALAEDDHKADIVEKLEAAD